MLIRNLAVSLVSLGMICPVTLAQTNQVRQTSEQSQVAARSVRGVSESGAVRTTAPTVGPHGGQVKQVGSLQTETLVQSGRMRVFVYNRQGQPLDLRKARGLATLQLSDNPKQYRYDLFPEIRKDKSADSLGVAVDLSQIAGQEVELAFQLVGVEQGKRQPTRFGVSAMVPRTEAQQVAADIARQKLCPVSGQPLGSMGEPIPVKLGDKTVYVCCAGCIDKVKSNPEKYSTAKPQLTVAPATAADAAAIERQQVCPVMDIRLGEMGTPVKVTGLERDVYLCCKGCLKKLEQDSQKYLAMLPPLPKTATAKVVKATKVDAQFVAAQKICPVMDAPLDGMGGPYKTVVQGRVVYLCCPGCAKKLQASPQAYLDKLAKQGVDPPLIR